MIGLFITIAAVPLLVAWERRGFQKAGRSPGDRTAGDNEDPNHAGTVDVAPTRTVSLCVERGSEADSPNPLGCKSWFPGLPVKCGASWFTGLLRGLLPRREAPPPRAALAAMDRAVAEVDTEGFFRASRQVVRNRLAGRFNLVADAIAASDARRVLSEPGLPEVLEVADSVIYSGRTLRQEDLAAWRDRVLLDLSRMEG